MLEVEVVYVWDTRKRSPLKEVPYYNKFIVKGHATEQGFDVDKPHQDYILGERICGAITLITCSLYEYLKCTLYKGKVILNKGYFEYKNRIDNKTLVRDYEADSLMNTLLLLLDYLYRKYPKQFSSFKIIERDLKEE